MPSIAQLFGVGALSWLFATLIAIAATEFRLSRLFFVAELFFIFGIAAFVILLHATLF